MVCNGEFCKNTKLKLNKAFQEMDETFEEVAMELNKEDESS